MTYRPDIDGLRAVAIVPVVLCHAGLTSLSGGFVGVDVFFVISGFLITSVILPETRNGTFSFLRFYERRIRRIIPALVVVVLATLLSMTVVALPDQLDQASKSGLAALLSVSNFYFESHSGYFSSAADFQAFLHTWSLSVEEQFYFLFPMFLIIAAKFRWNMRLSIIALIAISFGLSLWMSVYKPFTAFYLLPARIWELAIGSLLAVGVMSVPTSHLVRNVVSAIGLGLIAIGYVTIDPSTVFPGWAGLLPCLGAGCIIIASGPETLVGRLLSTTPVRFIGLISYSLYLWHWPILVTTRMALGEQHLPAETASVVVLTSFVVAVASWHWIEKPFRNARRMPLKPMALSLGGLASAPAILGLLLVNANGLPARLTPQANALLQASTDVDPSRIDCRHVQPSNQFGRCSLGRTSDLRGGGDEEVDFLLIGDSHADAVGPAFDRWAQALNLRGLILWQSNCPFLPDTERVPIKAMKRCADFRAAVSKRIATYPNARLVVLSGRWEYNWTGIRPERAGAREYLVDAETREWSQQASQRVFVRSLNGLIASVEATNRHVLLVGAVPEVGFDVPHTLALRANRNSARVQAPTFKHDFGLQTTLDTVFQDLARRHHHVQYASLGPVFCEGGQCRLTVDGRPIYKDDNHITASFSKNVVGPHLLATIKTDGIFGKSCASADCIDEARCRPVTAEQHDRCANVADAESAR